MLRALATFAATASLLAAAPSAGAASTLVITGAGNGHGIGMSQYGALGYAQHGWTAQSILTHFYTGTAVGKLGADSSTVRVLLQSGKASYTLRGAADVNGSRLDPAKTYKVTSGGTGVVIQASGARSAQTASPPLRVSAPSGGAVTLDGAASNGLSGGSYRGAIEFRPTGVFGLAAINAVSLENYVAGVISAEVPASWPTEALRAQAIAARTYAITTNAGGSQGFTQYADTRSQMYRGVRAETASTTAAARDTAGQVVTYAGKPVTTYFFSSSGGRTENVENSFVGSEPKPWLKSVLDPYDTVSPVHRWAPVRMTLTRAGAKLGGLVKGKLKTIRVLKRGVSPRIVQAQVVGTRGTTLVTGPQLRKAFGLRDTWIHFKVVKTKPRTTLTGGAPGSRVGPVVSGALGGFEAL